MIKKKYLYPLMTLALLIGIWEVLPKFLKTPVYVFPPISKIITATFINNTELFKHIYTTLNETIFGFLLGSLLGFCIGLMMAQSKTFALIALPYVVASNAIPVIAIAPIIIMWFGNGIMAKVAVSAFLCFFPLAINTYKGIITYPVEYEDLFTVYGASKFEFLSKYKLLNALPFIFSGLKLNATFSVIGCIVAEIIASNSGLGYGILQAAYSLNIPKLWGYVICSCSLGVFAYVTIHIIELFINKYLNIKS
jgi:NitT/TauT family transport system permease protein